MARPMDLTEKHTVPTETIKYILGHRQWRVAEIQKQTGCLVSGHGNNAITLTGTKATIRKAWKIVRPLIERYRDRALDRQAVDNSASGTLRGEATHQIPGQTRTPNPGEVMTQAIRDEIWPHACRQMLDDLTEIYMRARPAAHRNKVAPYAFDSRGCPYTEYYEDVMQMMVSMHRVNPNRATPFQVMKKHKTLCERSIRELTTSGPSREDIIVSFKSRNATRNVLPTGRPLSNGKRARETAELLRHEAETTRLTTVHQRVTDIDLRLAIEIRLNDLRQEIVRLRGIVPGMSTLHTTTTDTQSSHTSEEPAFLQCSTISGSSKKSKPESSRKRNAHPVDGEPDVTKKRKKVTRTNERHDSGLDSGDESRKAEQSEQNDGAEQRQLCLRGFHVALTLSDISHVFQIDGIQSVRHIELEGEPILTFVELKSAEAARSALKNVVDYINTSLDYDVEVTLASLPSANHFSTNIPTLSGKGKEKAIEKDTHTLPAEKETGSKQRLSKSSPLDNGQGSILKKVKRSRKKKVSKKKSCTI